MTASIIGCDAFSADRSLTVVSQCSSHGRRLTGGAAALALVASQASAGLILRVFDQCTPLLETFGTSGLAPPKPLDGGEQCPWQPLPPAGWESLRGAWMRAGSRVSRGSGSESRHLEPGTAHLRQNPARVLGILRTWELSGFLQRRGLFGLPTVPSPSGFLAAIVYVWWCALTRRRDRWLGLAVAALVTAGAFVAANHGDCPSWATSSAPRRSCSAVRAGPPAERGSPRGPGAWPRHGGRAHAARASQPRTHTRRAAASDEGTSGGLR